MRQLLVELPSGRIPLDSRMQPERVVLPNPTIGQDLRLQSCGEQLSIEELIAESAIVDEVEQSSYDLPCDSEN